MALMTFLFYIRNVIRRLQDKTKIMFYSNIIKRQILSSFLKIYKYSYTQNGCDSKKSIQDFVKQLITVFIASKLAYHTFAFLKIVASLSGAATVFPVIQRKCAKFALKGNMGS